MKKLVLLILLLSLFGTTLLVPDQKICVINMEKVFTSYYKTKLEDAKIKKQADVFRDYLKKLADERTKLETQYTQARDDSQNIGLSDVERENKKVDAQNKYRELQAKDSEIQQYNQQKGQFLAGEYDKSRNALLKEINSVVIADARKNGYSIVLDSSGNTSNNMPTVVFADNSLDITDQVIKDVNAGS